MPPWLTALAAVLGIVGLLGVAYAVFTSARVQKTVELYKLENEAQGKRIASLEDEKARTAEKLDLLEKQNAMLRDMVSGASAVEKLAGAIAKEEEARRHEHEVQASLVRETYDLMKDMWEAVTRWMGTHGA